MYENRFRYWFSCVSARQNGRFRVASTGSAAAVGPLIWRGCASLVPAIGGGVGACVRAAPRGDGRGESGERPLPKATEAASSLVLREKSTKPKVPPHAVRRDSQGGQCGYLDHLSINDSIS